MYQHPPQLEHIAINNDDSDIAPPQLNPIKNPIENNNDNTISTAIEVNITDEETNEIPVAVIVVPQKIGTINNDIDNEIVVEPIDGDDKGYFTPDKDKKPAAKQFRGEVNLDLDCNCNDEEDNKDSNNSKSYDDNEEYTEYKDNNEDNVDKKPTVKNVNNSIIDVFIPQYDFTMCKVKSTGPRGNWNTLKFPHKEIGGSCFGTCTCGISKVKGFPRHHMVAVLKLGLMAQLDENNIMPLGR